MKQANWFLVCCLSARERYAAAEITKLGFETFCPQLSRTAIVRGRRAYVTAALFPGYSFTRFDRDHDDWGQIRSIDGVLDIYRRDNIPVRIPDIQIATIQVAERAGVFDLTSATANFKTGDMVEIHQRGPFYGLMARIKSASSRKRVAILLDSLTMSIDPCLLRKV